MLRQILKAFNDARVLSTTSLAVRTGVHESLMMQMLDNLIQLGYLEEIEKCQISCTGCKQENACSPSSLQTQRMWTLSEKGRKSLNKS